MSVLAVETKRCSRCGEEKPLDAFSRQKIGRYGRRADCKDCQRVYNTAWKRENPDKIAAARVARYELKRDEILSYNRAWNEANPESLEAATRRYRMRLRGAETSEHMRRKRGTVTLEVIAAQKRAWREANPEKVAAQKRAHYLRHREKVIRRAEAWRKEHPDQRRAHSHTRRARQANAAGSGYTTAQHIADRVAYYGGCCVYCGGEWEAIDHRIPLSRGGSHWPANLVPCCKSCNSRKNAKTVREFLSLLAREGVRQHHG